MTRSAIIKMCLKYPLACTCHLRQKGIIIRYLSINTRKVGLSTKYLEILLKSIRVWLRLTAEGTMVNRSTLRRQDHLRFERGTRSAHPDARIGVYPSATGCQMSIRALGLRLNI